MAEYLAQDLVDHGRSGFGANTASELRFNHVERRLDIAPTMIMTQKIVFAIEVVVKRVNKRGPDLTDPLRSSNDEPLSQGNPSIAKKPWLRALPPWTPGAKNGQAGDFMGKSDLMGKATANRVA